ncbi:Hypothetical protein HDN1F_34160 [gamma proteobacterium HdN1]|nr:Hypothetical protein HDN1F_34160 [gamma proteobacterium HdN1]
MLAPLIMNLADHFDVLTESCRAFARAVEQDADLPHILPGWETLTDRPAAIAAMTQLWRLDEGDTLPSAGILCGSPTTLERAIEFNAAKNDFQQAVQKIREYMKDGKKTRLDRQVERVLAIEGIRTDELTLALKRTHLSRLDLLRCYAQIRILPKNLESISWTWAKTHSVIDPVSREDALVLATKLGVRARAMAEHLLAQLPEGTMLAYKKPLPNQLRANLTWRDEEGALMRKAVTISGIVLCQDSSLPECIIWREDPKGEKPVPRKQRTDVALAPEPYVKALRLHLYTDPENDAEPAQNTDLAYDVE